MHKFVSICPPTGTENAGITCRISKFGNNAAVIIVAMAGLGVAVNLLNTFCESNGFDPGSLEKTPHLRYIREPNGSAAVTLSPTPPKQRFKGEALVTVVVILVVVICGVGAWVREMAEKDHEEKPAAHSI